MNKSRSKVNAPRISYPHRECCMLFSISNTSLACFVLYANVNNSATGVLWSILLALEFPQISENHWTIPVGVEYLWQGKKRRERGKSS